MAVAKPTPFLRKLCKTYPSKGFILQQLLKNTPLQRVHFAMAIAKPTPLKSSFCNGCRKTHPSKDFIPA
jgi:hypothetical protein